MDRPGRATGDVQNTGSPPLRGFAGAGRPLCRYYPRPEKRDGNLRICQGTTLDSRDGCANARHVRLHPKRRSDYLARSRLRLELEFSPAGAPNLCVSRSNMAVTAQSCESDQRQPRHMSRSAAFRVHRAPQRLSSRLVKQTRAILRVAQPVHHRRRNCVYLVGGSCRPFPLAAFAPDGASDQAGPQTRWKSSVLSLLEYGLNARIYHLSVVLGRVVVLCWRNGAPPERYGSSGSPACHVGHLSIVSCIQGRESFFDQCPTTENPCKSSGGFAGYLFPGGGFPSLEHSAHVPFPQQ